MNDAVLIQQASGSHTYLLNLIVKDHAQYCLNHDFDYWPIYGSALTGKDRDRHAFWNKVALLRNAVEAGYKYIVWLDSDCYIADSCRDLREACPEDGFGLTWHAKPEWPESKDCYDHFNCGAVYFSNGTEAQRLLNLWWKASDDGHFWHDQHAFNKNALENYRKVWRKEPPVYAIGCEWNSVPFEEFRHPDPIVAAWHGCQVDISLRMDAMREFIEENKLRRMVDGCDAEEACQKAEFCMQTGQPEKAELFFAKAASLGVETVDFLREYGGCLALLKRWGEEVPLLRRALEKEPQNGLLWRMLGSCYDYLGEHELNREALFYADLWSPDAPAVMLNKAFFDLREGNWQRGFEGLRWDFLYGNRVLRYPYMEWNRLKPCKTLFVWYEQGIGDTLMLFRYVQELIYEGMEKIILEVQPALVPLLKEVHSRIEVIPQPFDKAIPFTFDAHVGMFSLPGLFNASPGTTDGKAYLSAPADKVEKWAEVIKGEGLKVGFSWAGSQGHANNVNRNMEAVLFDEIVKTPGTEWFSLQHGIEVPNEVMVDTPEVLFIGHAAQDMADVAGMLANLDLVITVDSAIAHLAGAMGIPCWTLISKSSDWRWLLNRDDTVWYESMRLFRQTTLGEWEPVMERVQEALNGLLESEKGAKNG